jgi:hypothetical protein
MGTIRKKDPQVDGSFGSHLSPDGFSVASDLHGDILRQLDQRPIVKQGCVASKQPSSDRRDECQRFHFSFDPSHEEHGNGMLHFDLQFQWRSTPRFELAGIDSVLTTVNVYRMSYITFRITTFELTFLVPGTVQTGVKARESRLS